MKILVSDLDGTIYRHKTVSSQDLAAIKHFTKENLLVIATGRNSTTFANFQNRFQLDYQYLILSNGAKTQAADGKILSIHPFLSSQSFKPLIEILHSYTHHDLSLGISLVNNNLYLPSYQSSMEEKVLRQMQQPVLSICIEVKNQSLALTEEIYTKIITDTSFHAERNNHYIDILPEDVSKKNALLELMEKCHFHQKDMYFIGDSYNDISMFDINDHSFIIDQGNTNLNQYASHKVPSIAACIEMIDKEDCSL